MPLRPSFYAIALLCALHFIAAQNRPKSVTTKNLHLGIFPGIGTNGVHDLRYENNIAINLFSGQSYGNDVFQFSGINQFYLNHTKGISISGLANVVGGFPFHRDVDIDDFSTYIKAIQVGGLFNVVNGEGLGAQISGGINSIAKSFDGAQISGLTNFVGQSFSGVQLSLLYNHFNKYGFGVQTGGLINYGGWIAGVQMAGLANIAKSELDGVQLGMVNYVGNRQSVAFWENKFYWMQIGLVNGAFRNGDGLQLGVINLGEDIGFSQIGLINIASKSPRYPIGLLNISGNMGGFVKFAYNRLFRYNIQVATGSRLLLNEISYSFDGSKGRKGIGYAIGDQVKWGFGNYEYFFDGFLTLNHVVQNGTRWDDPNLVYGGRVQFGYNIGIHNKLPDCFLFVGLSGNMHSLRNQEPLVSGYLSTQTDNLEGWGDFVFGIQL